MQSLFRRWLLILVGVVLVTATGLVDVSYDTPADLLIFAAILAVLNAILRPIVIILTLPVTVLTLGLFALVVNGLMFWLAAQVYSGVEVGGFLHAAFAAMLVSIFAFVAGSLLR